MLGGVNIVLVENKEVDGPVHSFLIPCRKGKGVGDRESAPNSV